MTERPDCLPARLWLEKMDHDLAVVRLFITTNAIPTDVACFHAQQAVEKALKALLAAHEIVPERTHDVVALLDDVLPMCPGLKDEIVAVTALNGYAVAVRYPYHMTDPSTEEARRAVETAERVCAIVRNHINEGRPRPMKEE